MKSHRSFVALAAILAFALLTFAGGLALVRATDASNIAYVSQIGGDSRTIAFYGQYAYLGVGPRVIILNVANPASPVVVQQSAPLSIAGGADAIVEDIAIPDASGNIYVAAGDAGLFILNVTNPGSPTQPTFVSNYNTPDPTDYAVAVDVSGDVAAVAFDTGGLVAIDISTAANPTLLDATATGGDCRDVALVAAGLGEVYAFVAAGTAGIEAYEIAPFFGLEDTFALNDYAEGLAVNPSRAHAYVADSGGGLHVIDITNPAALAAHSSVATAGLALDVSYFGTYVFVADDNAGVRLFDLADEMNPAPFTPPNVATTGFAVAVAAGNNRIYVADSWAGMSIIDFSNVSNVNVLSTYATLGEVNGVAVSANSPYAFSASGYTGLVSTNVASRTVPLKADATILADYALNGAITENYAFVADTTGGLQVVDISVPDALNVVATLPTNSLAVDVAVSGDYAYVAQGLSGLFIANITDPTMPVFVTSLGAPELPNATGLAVAGDYVYVAADLDGFYVVDVGDPNNPAVTDSLPLLTGAAWDVAVVGGTAYLAADDGGLQIVDVSDPHAISLVGQLSGVDLPLALDVVVVGSRAVVAGGSDGAFVVDVSTPAAPAQVGYYDTAGYASRVAVAGAIYVADIEGGMYLLNYGDFDFGETDLKIATTDNLATAVAGASHTYTITVSNLGPSDVNDAVVSDDFTGVLNSVSWTCTATLGSACDTANGAGSLSATVDLLVGGEARFVATGNIASNASGTLSNTATVAPPAGTTDINQANDSATDTTNVTTEADLQIAKSGTPDPVIPGRVLTYTVTVTNQGPSDLTSAAALTDVLPAAVSFVSVTPGSPACAHAGGEVTCAVPPLASGSSTIVTVVVTVDAAANAPLHNSATVVGADADPDMGNNTAVITTAIKTADLALVKSALPDPVVAGEQLTYTLDITNLGPDGATDVLVVDTLPAGVSFVSAVPGSPTCTEAGGVVTCMLGALANGAATQVGIVTLVDSSATGSVENTAVVSAAEYDADPTNNGVTTTTGISLEADLSLTNSDGQVNIVAGEALTYTLTVGNAGPSDVSSALVVDNFPVELEGVTWQCAGSGGAVCASPNGSGSINLGVDVPVGGEITILATATVADTATGLLINTADVLPPAGVTDPNLANNTATDTNSLGAQADVSIAVAAVPGSVQPGEMISLTITVANAGPSAAGGVQVTSLLPASVAVAAAQGCTVNGSQLICDVGVLQTGEQTAVTVSLTAVSVATVQQQFTVFAVNDSNTANNTAVVELEITPFVIYLPYLSN
ncbi:MAG: DUF11 domain-containing protein [Anaerolineales bacterium]|nr:DUF11 domain-containing protein [Anaerolineales bacterium]